MSGGSFDYLCFVSDLNELVEKRYQLEPMRQALEKYGNRGRAAARETYLVEQLLRSWEDILEVHLARLQPIWRAVEWHHSADSGLDDVEIVLDHYIGVPIAEVHKFVPVGNEDWGCTGCSWIAHAKANRWNEERARESHEKDHREP